ncbi:3-oxoacyl-[acyl-carrier-protein] reductase FabG-like isoform X2 [Hyperolius riggenbachi]|uniref:3-oxoacyl-[acyl-carrier-protein] reductase FabG-like isoform X2 n=1 Tax=Hyperolius riggenbachi TaxID=752182 RepID=UPI0035A27EB9
MAAQQQEQVVALQGKVCLVTGASSGIGAGTAILFSRLGARLALNGRNLEKLQETAQRCEEASGQKPLLVPGELTDEAVLQRIVEETVGHYGQLDVLVNSGGILVNGTLEGTTLKDYDHQMNVNVRSLFYLSQLATPHLIKTKGNIVNVSSITGQRSFPGVMAYCMSKAAVDHMTRCAALELASKQVRVNAVCPGVIITEVHKRAGMSEEKYQEFLEHCKETHALGRPGNVDEVAKTIAFLASDAASFITGVAMPVDGGRHAMCPR